MPWSFTEAARVAPPGGKGKDMPIQKEAAALEPTGGGVPLVTPTVTHYQEVAATFIAGFDLLVAGIPQLQSKHASTLDFVRGHLNVPDKFVATAVASVELTPELQNVNRLDVPSARDMLQYNEAMRLVRDRVKAFYDDLQYTMNSKKAVVVSGALQIYDIAQGLSRDPNSGPLTSVVANLKRDFGSRGRKKKGESEPPPAPAAKYETE